MSKIIFNADKTGSFDALISSIGEHQIRLIFSGKNIPESRILYSGFVVVNEHNNIVEGDYTDYKYKYRDLEDPNMFDLDNDNVPYIPASIPPDKGEEFVYRKEEDPETKNTDGISYTYTKDQMDNILETKLQELSDDCKEFIENGDSVLFEGGSKHFSYSLEKGDQNNIDDLFNYVMQTASGHYYHADGQSQEYFEPYQIFNIYSALKLNKLNSIARYNQLVLMLKDMVNEDREYTEDEVEYINQVSFKKTKLKGSFYKNFMANKTQNEEQMEALKQCLISKGVKFPEEKSEDNK